MIRYALVRQVIRSSAIRASVILLSSTALACSDAPKTYAPLAERDSTMLDSALRQAIIDSVSLARATFALPAVLETSITEDDTSVTSVEKFRLVKRSGAEFRAVDRSQTITGDRSLLSSMYSFENSRGELRSETEATFSSIGFGADQRGILRELLSRRLALSDAIRDSATFDGRGARIVRFHGDGVAGTLVLDRASLATRSVAIRRESGSIIGGYVYTMSLHLTDPESTLRIPARMHTAFHYERVMSAGDGTVTMSIDTSGSSATVSRSITR